MAGKKRLSSTAIKPGQITNPLGINGYSTSLQPYHKRAEHYLEKYKPSEIILIASDPIKLDAFTSWDAIVLKRLAACLSGKSAEERAEVGFLLDRKEGKAVERHITRVIRSVEDLSDEELAALAEGRKQRA